MMIALACDCPNKAARLRQALERSGYNCPLGNVVPINAVAKAQQAPDQSSWCSPPTTSRPLPSWLGSAKRSTSRSWPSGPARLEFDPVRAACRRKRFHRRVRRPARRAGRRVVPPVDRGTRPVFSGKGRSPSSRRAAARAARCWPRTSRWPSPKVKTAACLFDFDLGRGRGHGARI